ncbi:hypothetical protein [Psychrobacter sp. LV10R520-6]|uniref:hypothetical protein n=1 Tax=Psychrobacter sp. LV10R520-6 TaxID=1415574 RepID=UPI002AA0B58E|nr:hypothetical protein [Psychrobacter sp. LV10R520-6]
MNKDYLISAVILAQTLAFFSLFALFKLSNLFIKTPARYYLMFQNAGIKKDQMINPAFFDFTLLS